MPLSVCHYYPPESHHGVLTCLPEVGEARHGGPHLIPHDTLVVALGRLAPCPDDQRALVTLLTVLCGTLIRPLKGEQLAVMVPLIPARAMFDTVTKLTRKCLQTHQLFQLLIDCDPNGG